MVGKSVAAMGELAIGMRGGSGGPKFEMGTVLGSGKNTLYISHSLKKTPTGFVVCTIGRPDEKGASSRKGLTSQIVWRSGKSAFAAAIHASGTGLDIGTYGYMFGVNAKITVMESGIQINTDQPDIYYRFSEDLNYFWIAWTD